MSEMMEISMEESDLSFQSSDEILLKNFIEKKKLLPVVADSSVQEKLSTSARTDFRQYKRDMISIEKLVVPPLIFRQMQIARKWEVRSAKIVTMEGEFSAKLWTAIENSSSRASGIENNPTPPSTSTSDAPKGKLIKKQRSVPDNSEDRYRCSSQGCSKTFQNLGSLRKHTMIHRPRTHKCDCCDKSFVESSKLKRHSLVHSGEKPYQCPHEGCGKRFSLDFNLRTHFRIHTNFRPFICSVEGCKKSFSQSNNLRTHIATHFKTPKSRSELKAQRKSN